MRFIFFIFLFICSKSFCQISIGIKGGVNISNEYHKLSNSSKILHWDKLLSIQAGFSAKLPLAKNVYFNPSLQYSGKGSSQKINITTFQGIRIKEYVSTKLNYIEALFDFVYQYKISAISLIGGMGPSIAYGFSGNNSNPPRKAFMDERPNGALDKRERLDAGINFIIGVIVKNRFQLSVNYNYGILNNYTENPDIVYYPPMPKVKRTNRVLGISSSWYFLNINRKKKNS